MLQTRGQRDMALAARFVTEVVESEAKETASVYQGLCHSFPVFVLQCGLAQAVAFSAAKEGKEKGIARAHQLLLSHLAQVHGATDASAWIRGVHAATLPEYLRMTRRTLDAAVYFKRFAEALIQGEA